MIMNLNSRSLNIRTARSLETHWPASLTSQMRKWRLREWRSHRGREAALSELRLSLVQALRFCPEKHLGSRSAKRGNLTQLGDNKKAELSPKDRTERKPSGAEERCS
jgi:hypothetical protein